MPGQFFQIKPFGPAMPQPYVVTDADSYNNMWQVYFVATQIMDRREVRFVLTKPQDFFSDWAMMQRRADNLKNCPYLEDCDRFPDRLIINDLMVMNRLYNSHLEECISLYPTSKSLEMAKDDNSYLYKVWDAARDAKCEYYYVHIRRQALRKLKILLDEIDPTWYDMGRMPPHIPYWFFTEVR